MAQKNGAMVFAPRVDVAKRGAIEFFFCTEKFFPAFAKTRLVARVELLTTASRVQHNRSYQLVRLGLEIKDLQFGGGLTLDEYGTRNTVYGNAGIFLRKKW